MQSLEKSGPTPRRRPGPVPGRNRWRALRRSRQSCCCRQSCRCSRLTIRFRWRSVPRCAERIATEIESLGGSIDSFGGNNSFGVSAEVLASDFGQGLGLVADVVLDPTFPATAFKREREIQLAAIKAQKDQLLQSCFRAMRRAMFGETGYGLDALGSEESVPKLQTTGLKSFHQKLAVPNNCVLAIYGDINVKPVVAAVKKAFARWTPNRALSSPDRIDVT